MQPEKRSSDSASQKMLKKALDENIKVVWDRLDSMQPQCRFGELGICCRLCNMGPCRIIPSGKGAQRGVCGADKDTIVARNLLRAIASGVASHSDHGRDIAYTLLLVSENKAPGYRISDPEKLKEIALIYGIEIKDKEIKEIAREVALRSLNEFGKQEGNLRFILRAPQKTQEVWRKYEILPRSIDREIVEAMHRTHMGVDTDYKNIILHGLRTALADGWGGSMIATDLSDILFGSPYPLRAKVNLGVLKSDFVNIIVHGHEPALSDVVSEAVKDEELIRLAKEKGAKGINLCGMCCTANEILMRHGIPVAGNFLQQELAILTGAVEVMMVDVQCIMSTLADIASCFHTKLITTSPKAKFPGVTHINFEEENALNIAKEIVRIAIENYPNRNSNRVCIPPEEMDLIAGFTAENIPKIIGGRYRSTWRPVNDGIIQGRIRGIAGVVGCNNPKITHDYGHTQLVKELIKNDVLVVVTGCSAIANAKAGLLKPEAAFEFAGKGLQEICEAVGIPPVLHAGSCVDNSRILISLCELVKEGGIGDSISELPVAGAAPEWMSEKAIAIGFYFVASGVFTVFGWPQPVLGSENVTNFITKDLENITGGKFAFEQDPIKAAHLIIEHINKKREHLKLKPLMFEGVKV